MNPYILGYLSHFTFYHVGDDTHLIVENFRSLMLEYETEGYSDTKQGRIFGQIIQSPNSGFEYFWGGPGYTLDRIALRKLHDFMPNCYPNKESHAEDGYITKCVKQLDLEGVIIGISVQDNSVVMGIHQKQSTMLLLQRKEAGLVMDSRSGLTWVTNFRIGQVKNTQQEGRVKQLGYNLALMQHPIILLPSTDLAIMFG